MVTDLAAQERPDRKRMFCSCVKVREAWQYMRELVSCDLSPTGPQGEEDWRLICFLFPRDRIGSEVVWLIANYLDLVQKQCIGGGVRLLKPAVKGRFGERLREIQGWSVKRLTVML